MRFTNGYWLIRDGMQLQFPKIAYDSRVEAGKLTVYAPCMTMENKGNCLNGGTITIEFTAPRNDIIEVHAYHFKGAVPKGPAFSINRTKADVRIEETDKELVFASGDTSVRITKHPAPFAMRFYYKETLLTQSLDKALGYAVYKGKTPYMKEELTLSVGEYVYGLGERFTAFVKNGQSVEIANRDGGTSSDQAYKNIPFYLTNRGYGVFTMQPEDISYEIASEKVNRVQFSVEGESLSYCVIGGGSMKRTLALYTDLTGKPALPPAWSFGLWLSTSFLTDYDTDTVTRFLDGMEQSGIPVSVFHFDCCWMEEFEWCNFKWNRHTFTDPERMLKDIHTRGIRVCVWINPYIGQKSPLFDEGLEHGYFLQNPDGSVYQRDEWQSGTALVDFTNPDAVKWYQDHLERLLDMGVDCFKTDFGERIPTTVSYFDGSDPKKMHNYYAELYNRAVFELLERKRGKGEAVVFARSATAGTQKYPVHWGGDCVSTYPSMAETLRGGLSFALSGFGYWSHDIGGFEDGTSADLYNRWTQFGLLSSHSRYHGSGAYKVPWLFGDSCVAVARKFTRLKLSLMPYLFTQGCDTSRTGIPMMRPMVLEFPEDETCAFLDRQYMMGDSLLVAPVFAEDGSVSYYLPKGVYTNLLTGERKTGGAWYKETYDELTMPLFIRDNTILVTGRDDCAEYDYGKDALLHLYEIADARTKVCSMKGKICAQTAAKRSGSTLSIMLDGFSGCTTLAVHGYAVVSAEGAAILRTEKDTVYLCAQKDAITLKLK